MVPLILVIDDNDLIRRSLQDFFQNSINCNIICAINGKEALHMIQGGLRPNIIISDIEMPEMNGLELLTSIKPFNIPVIVMSGKNHFENQAIINGATAFLLKPLDFDVLLAMIKKYARP